jgi:phage FluMu gp28-like protein
LPNSSSLGHAFKNPWSFDRTLSKRANRTLWVLSQVLPLREWLAVDAWRQTFRRFQQEILLDSSRYSLLNKARQIGASHIYAGWAVLRGAFFGELTVIVSVKLTDSNEVIKKARSHAKLLTLVGSEWAQHRSSADTITFVNGGRVICNAQESGARGFTGNVFLDELAYYKHPVEAWDAALGAITHGFNFRGASTPNGVGNFWHQLFTDPSQNHRFSLHEYTIDDAIDDGMVLNMEELWAAARGDERVFNQLYRCSFLDSDMQYLPTEMVQDLLTLPGESEPKEGDFYGGMDIGKTVDLTVLVIIRVVGKWRWVHKVFTRKRTDGPEIQRLFAVAFNTFHCSRVAVDATGLGSFPAEQGVKDWGLRRLIPVVFGPKNKEDMATGLYQTAVERLPSPISTEGGLPRLRIPRELGKEDKAEDHTVDRMHPERQKSIERSMGVPAMGPSAAQICRDLLSLRRIVMPSAAISYDAPHTAEGHADSAWALALALSVARSESARGVWNP